MAIVSPNDGLAIDGRVAAAEVAGLAALEVLRLPEVGWLHVQTRGGYVGRNPMTGKSVTVGATRTPFFIADPGVPGAFPNETARFLAALHPDGDTEDEEPFVVRRTPALDAVAAHVHTRLRAGQTAVVDGLGTFSMKGGRASFSAAAELKRALNP